MSEYHAQTTKWTKGNEDCIVDGLVAAGYDRSVIEVHETPQQLIDYVGRRTTYLDATGDKATIIVRRHNLGYSSGNDLGFRLNEKTGTYEAIVSEYDTRAWGPKSDRMKKAKAGYTESVSMKTAKQKGFKFLGRKIVNGKVQLQFMDTRVG